jgi:hypothetical protein
VQSPTKKGSSGTWTESGRFSFVPRAWEEKADIFADSGPDIFSHPLPPRPDPRPPHEKPEKLAVRLGFAGRKPTTINVDRDLTFYRCLEVIRARFPVMTLGDSMYVRERGPPKLKEEIEDWSNDDDVLDLHFPDARVFKKN